MLCKDQPASQPASQIFRYPDLQGKTNNNQISITSQNKNQLSIYFPPSIPNIHLFQLLTPLTSSQTNPMATQRRTPHDRIAAGEEKEAEFKPVVGGKSNIAPAVPAYVFYFYDLSHVHISLMIIITITITCPSSHSPILTPSNPHTTLTIHPHDNPSHSQPPH